MTGSKGNNGKGNGKNSHSNYPGLFPIGPNGNYETPVSANKTGNGRFPIRHYEGGQRTHSTHPVIWSIKSDEIEIEVPIQEKRPEYRDLVHDIGRIAQVDPPEGVDLGKLEAELTSLQPESGCNPPRSRVEQVLEGYLPQMQKYLAEQVQTHVEHFFNPGGRPFRNPPRYAEVKDTGRYLLTGMSHPNENSS